MATLPQRLTLTASLQCHAIHTGQSLSGAFWNGLVLSAKIFVIDIILFIARILAAHPSRTWCYNSSAEQQNLAKNQTFFFFLMDINIVQAFMCFLKRQKAKPDTPTMKKNLCWSEPPTWRCNSVSEHDHFPSQMLGGQRT